MANLFIPGVQDEVFDLAQRPVAPLFEFLIKGRGGAADLAAGDLATAQLLDDLGHLRVATPCTYISAKVSVSAFSLRTPALRRRRIELHPADLRHGEFEFADPRLDVLGLKAVRLALTLVAALVRREAQGLLGVRSSCTR